MVQLLDNNAKASYTCDLGLSLKGDSERLCSTDGSGWTSADPTCGTKTLTFDYCAADSHHIINLHMTDNTKLRL